MKGIASRRPFLAGVLAAGLLSGAASFALGPRMVVTAQVVSSPAQAGAPAARPGGPPGGRGYARPDPLDPADRDGWTSMFDGATLNGWDGNPAVWRVENGAIVAESVEGRRIGTSYMIWKGGEIGDFEWTLDVKLEGDIHSGIAYRSWTDPNRAGTLGPAAPPAPVTPPAGAAAAAGRGGRGPQPPPDVPSDPRWMLYGPGSDNDADRRNTGNVEDRNTARRFIGWRGMIVRTSQGKRPTLVGTIGDPDALMAAIRPGDWNTFHLIARGPQLVHMVNGQLMAITMDEDPTFFTPRGLLGWSIEQGALGKVSVRNLWLKRLDSAQK